MNFDIERDDDNNSILWRRIQLSKAKLKGVTEMSAMISGFSVVAMVELDLKDDTNSCLLLLFAITTACLVSTAMVSILIATCILPYVDTVTKVNSVSYAKQWPHENLIRYIDLSWFLANSVSICLFVIDVVLLCWIKFPTLPALCITFILVPVLIILFSFSIIFYRKSIKHQTDICDRKLDKLEALSKKLEKSAASSLSSSYSGSNNLIEHI